MKCPICGRKLGAGDKIVIVDQAQDGRYKIWHIKAKPTKPPLGGKPTRVWCDAWARIQHPAT